MRKYGRIQKLQLMKYAPEISSSRYTVKENGLNPQSQIFLCYCTDLIQGSSKQLLEKQDEFVQSNKTSNYCMIMSTFIV